MSPGVGVAVSPFIGSSRVPGLWLPTRLTGCVEWYRADMGVTTLPNIARWLDLSGSFNHVSQTTAARKPSLSVDHLLFDGTADHLSGAVLAGVNSGYTVGVALQFTAFPAGAAEWAVNNGQVGTNGQRFGGSGGNRQQDHGGVAVVNWGAGTTAAERWIFRHDGVGGQADFCLNGAHQAPQALANNIAPAVGTSIGAALAAANPAHVRIWADYSYSTRLSDADTILLDNRLAALQAGTTPPALPGAPVFSLERPDLHAGEAISDWANQGTAGAARDLAQAAVANQPVLIPYDPTILQPFAHFDGADDYMAGAWVQAQPVHRFAAALIAETGTIWDSVFDGMPTANRGRVYAMAGPVQIGAHAGAQLTVVAAPTAWHRIEVGCDGVSSRLRIDDLAPATGNLGTNNPGGLVLGASGGGVANFADTRIADFFECNAIQSAGNQTRAHAYMTDRYGI